MNDDWLDMIVALLHANARFLVVGAHALAVHGVPRATHDLDIWIEPTPENASRVLAALAAFGAPMDALGLDQSDLDRPGLTVQLGLPPNRIDLLTELSGLSDFDTAWNGRLEHKVREHVVPFIGRSELLQNKRASGRLKDLADVEALGEKTITE